MLESPIQNLNSVDLVGRRKDGGVDLLIVASGPLDASPATQELLLQKVRCYLGEINTEGFQVEFQHPPPEKVRIIVSCDFGTDGVIVELINRCKPWVEQNNARIELEQKPNG